MKFVSKHLTSIVVGLLCALSATAMASQVGSLIQFSAGTPARAAEVNANLRTLADAINDNDQRIQDNESALRAFTDREYVSVEVGGVLSQGSQVLSSVYRYTVPSGKIFQVQHISCAADGFSFPFGQEAYLTLRASTGDYLIVVNTSGKYISSVSSETNQPVLPGSVITPRLFLRDPSLPARADRYFCTLRGYLFDV